MKFLQISLLFFWVVVNSQTMVDGNTPANTLPVNTLIGPDWSLDFSDEFNDLNLNSEKWTIQNSTSSRSPRPNIGINDWWWKTANVSVANGNLVLRVDKHDFNTMYCGSVNSNNKYETKFGYFETRVKIAEAVKGTHTAFWFQGDNQGNIDNSGRDGAEIDVFESAWLQDYTKAVLHIDGYGTSAKANTVQYTTPGMHTGYHTFGFYWTPEFMKIYYDGVLKVTYSDPKWVVQADEYVWLSDGASFGLTGDYFTKLAVGTLTNAYFDYVRVWKSTKTNIALGKTVTVESFSSATTNGDKLVDGNKTATVSGWVSGLNHLPTWAEIDLGGSYNVNGFSFYTGNFEYKSPFIKDFKFQYWNGNSWINAVSKTGNTSGIVEEYFTAVTTNKIRLYITANTENYVRLYELEVYGEASTPLGIKQSQKQPFAVYPNEVKNGILNIIGDQEVRSLAVYTILGAKINTPFENGRLLVDALVPGIYFLKVNNKYTFKFIKK